ncbi:MAG: hypothetical protein ABL963_09490 [Longimicrobiales bacterium]
MADKKKKAAKGKASTKSKKGELSMADLKKVSGGMARKAARKKGS